MLVLVLGRRQHMTWPVTEKILCFKE